MERSTADRRLSHKPDAEADRDNAFRLPWEFRDVGVKKECEEVRIAIDTGGTFTDCVYVDGGNIRVLKVFSTPSDPAKAVLEGVSKIAGNGPASVRHGTTVGTNALLERSGARTALITTAGFEDVIAIGRQARSSLYDWFAEAPTPLVPKERRFGIAERVAADGTILRHPDEDELVKLRERIKDSGAEAVAVCLLFSFANPGNEMAVAEALADLGLPMSLSHKILPEFREYERTSTVAVNAYLAPKVGTYLARLNGAALASLEVMQSSGGIASAAFAAEQPVRTVLSGPAGGVMGAYFAAKRAGLSKVIAFDMGGTSTDVSAIEMDAGGLQTTSESTVSGLPVGVPALEIHTVGAGGGSIASFDVAGLLHVGPESAGASPGPISYGEGMRPTVTDANVLLGRLDTANFLGGGFRLDRDRVREAMMRERGSFETAEQFAEAILRVAEAAMEQAIRVITVEKGHDPREFTLVAFGGAGPLHACALGRALRLPRVMIPKWPGALSAAGILLSDTVHEYSKTVMTAEAHDLEPLFRGLEAQSSAGNLQRSVDMRYAGQGYELNVTAGTDCVERFHAAHEKRFGYADKNRPVEFVTIRVRATVGGEQLTVTPKALEGDDGRNAVIAERPVFFDGHFISTRLYDRELLVPGDHLAGPAIVVEYSSTTVVPDGWRLMVDPFENLLIERMV